MWWPYLLACLILLSTVNSYKSGFYASGRYGKRTPLTPESLYTSRPLLDFRPGREQRSGLFWTGSRYSRRGSDLSGMKYTRKGSENFFMGSRYGKRSDTDETPKSGYDVDLCKYSLYPCSSGR